MKKYVMFVLVFCSLSTIAFAAPDLVISSVSSLQIKAVPSEQVTVSGIIENIGDAPAIAGWQGYFRTTVYLSNRSNANWGTEGYSCGEFRLAALNEYTYYEFSFNIQTPTSPGTYYLRIKADDFNGIAESDEANNWSEIIILEVFPNDCYSNILLGKEQLFVGSFSSLKTAARYFKNAANSSACDDIRQAKFLDAMTRIAMLGVSDGNDDYLSVMQIGKLFGFETDGDDFNDVFIDYPVNQHNYYKMPQDAPDANWLSQNFDANMATEIDSIISQVESITETPSNRFSLYFEPSQTGMVNAIEIDYAEVKLLQSSLKLLKSINKFKSAYDISIEQNYKFSEKLWGNCFSISDLLVKHSELLKVIPASSLSVGGKSILLESKQNLVEAINDYISVLDYIQSEADDQADDFLSIPAENQKYTDKLTNNLIKLRDSLLDDHSEIYTAETTKKYLVKDCSANTLGEMQLVFGFAGKESGGILRDNLAQYTITSFDINDSQFRADLTSDKYLINYNNSPLLSNAQSILFEPFSCGGSTNYNVTQLDSCLFEETGNPQGWNAENGNWTYNLPFNFSFYGVNYSSIIVNADGYIEFDSHIEGGYWNYYDSKRIFPFAYDFNNTNGDIYITQSSSEVKIRWFSNTNFCIVLFSDGKIRFDYGSNDTGYQPYVGISKGNGEKLLLGNFYGYSWDGGYIQGTISPDGNSITNVSADFWGESRSQNIQGLSMAIDNVSQWQENIDLNPIFGSSLRYPNPVNLRDLLPEFNKFNKPVPSTFGKGLNNDPTLGGVTPSKTQKDWNMLFNAQPCGQFYLPQLYNWQMISDFVMFWLNEQLVFQDQINDVTFDESGNLDICQLYLGMSSMNSNTIHGEIFFADISPWNADRRYVLSFKSSESGGYSNGEFQTEILVQNGQCVSGNAYLYDGSIGFYISVNDTPLPGKFLSVSAYGAESADENKTALQILPLGKITGTVSCPGYSGGVIYIEACSDKDFSSGSIIKTVMLDKPGSFEVDGLGMGWKGYVRAWTEALGANPIEWQAFNVYSEPVRVEMRTSPQNNINLSINFPNLLVSGVTVNNSFGTEVYQEKWYAFEAIEGGEYNFIFNQDNNLKMEIIDRDGMTSSFESYTWQNPWDYNWNAYAGGRYYVKVSPEWWYPDLAVNYSLTMTTNASTYQSDFASIEGPGVPDEKVDFIDFVFLSDYWLQECSEPYWCEKTDINKDGTVDILDLVQFVEQWLYEK